MAVASQARSANFARDCSKGTNMNATAVAHAPFEATPPPAPSAAARKVQTVADLMEPPVGLFGPQVTVREATEALREQVKTAFITYLYVVDAEGRLLGLVVMREMLLAGPDATLQSLMIADPFALDS